MHMSSVHIAGIGISITKDAKIGDLALSAVIKALLDAGVTYSSVDQSVAGLVDDQLQVPRSCFDALGTRKGPICVVDNHSALFTTVQCISSGAMNCAVLVGLDKENSTRRRQGTQYAAIATVLVSDRFLTSHAYMKDSAILVRACALTNCIRSQLVSTQDDPRGVDGPLQSVLRQARLDSRDVQIVEIQQNADSNIWQALGDFHTMQPGEPSQPLVPLAGATGFPGLCGLVWRLRGWAQERSLSPVQLRNCLQYTSGPGGSASVVVLSRSDGQPAPVWNDIENLRDGRERLGYNPAIEVREISHEDLEAVRAREGDRLEKIMNQLQLPVRGGDRVALARL